MSDDERAMVEQMEWLGDQLDEARSEAAANDDRARYWEQQYRRLAGGLVRVAREARSFSSPSPQEPTERMNDE